MKSFRIISHLVVGLLLCGFFSLEARAATRTVDVATDAGPLTACTAAPNDCDLRGAISGAANNDIINFDPSLNGGTITLGLLISLPRPITIAGPGADKLTISGGNTTSLFESITTPGSLVLSGLTFANGNGAGGGNGGQGGAIEVNSSNSVTFDSVVFRDNSAPILGGAVLCFAGTCRFTNSTFTNNSAPGASVLYGGFGITEITNTTITGNNETSSNYGALYLRGTNLIRNCTIANNSGRSNLYVSTENVTLTLANTILAGGSQSDIVHNGGNIVTNGGNFIGNNNFAGSPFTTAGSPNANGDYVGTFLGQLNPQLAALGNYGGGTLTRPPLQNSLALDHGVNCVVNNSCSPAQAGPLTTDQRGAPRQIGAFVDIGAFETNFVFNTNSLPNGVRMTPYDQQLAVTRQTSFAEKDNAELILAPFTFETVPPSGATGLPPGLTLETTGQLHGTPTVAGGYSFLVKVIDQADGMAGIFQYTLLITTPTAAAVSISGRVLTSTGAGLKNAWVILTDTNGSSRTVQTGSLGYYRFEGVNAGAVYVLTVSSKNYQFEPQVVSVNEDLLEMNFYAMP